MTTEVLKYPVGHFEMTEKITAEILSGWTAVIQEFPEKLTAEVTGMTDGQLDTPYRPGGWTVRQLVHHCADSHMNSLIRFKLALTEKEPIIKPYFEDRWAELPDSKSAPIESSLKILEGVHERWADLLQHLSNDQFSLTYVHPEQNKRFRLDESTGLYAWHCNHHLTHIINLKRKKAWSE
jgi:hypothetical protein